LESLLLYLPALDSGRSTVPGWWIVLIELAGLLAVASIWLLWQLVVPISDTVVLFLLGAAFPSCSLTRQTGWLAASASNAWWACRSPT
jgi:hypothetical protein